MKWISVEIKKRSPAIDILFTDGKKIYQGWLEGHNFGDDLVFYNDCCNSALCDHWPENITHWVYYELPEPPKE